jgi:hypothetical protein
MGEQEKPLETLEEKFARLREEGLSDKEILRVVLEENLEADIDELVRITGMSKLDIGRIKGSVSRTLKRQEAKREAEAPPEPPTPYKTELDATAILREILSKHPDISPKVVDEVCSWAEYGPIHPTQLVYLLQSMRGIQSTTANIVAQKYSLALQKAQQEGRVQIPPPMYSPQLQPPQWGAPFPMPFQTPSQPQPQMLPLQQPSIQAPTLTPFPVVTQQQPSFTSPPYSPYWQPPQDVEKVVKGQIEDMKKYVEAKLETLRPKEERYVEIEEPLRTPEGRVIVDDEGKPIVRTVRTPVSHVGQYQPYPMWQRPEDVSSVVKREIDDMKKYVDTKLETLRPREEGYVEISEPLRTPDGKVIVDSEGNPVVRTVRTPVSQASQIALGGDPELRFLEKMKHYKEIFGKEELTPEQVAEKVRSIIKEEVPKKEVEAKPVTPEDVEKAVAEASAKAAQTVLAEVKKEDREERRHRELMDAIQRTSAEKLVEGYKSDAYRFLGQGMGEVARVVEKKEPVKIIIQGARDILSGPPPKEVEEGAREGVLTRLPPEWVAEE